MSKASWQNYRTSKKVFILSSLIGVILLNVIYISLVHVGKGFLEQSLESEVLRREARLAQNMIDFVRVQVSQDDDEGLLEWLDDPLLSFQTVLEPALKFSDLLLGIRHYDQEGEFLMAYPPDQSNLNLEQITLNKVSSYGSDVVFKNSFDLSTVFPLLQLNSDGGSFIEPVVVVTIAISGEGENMDGGIAEIFLSGFSFLEERERIHSEIQVQANRIIWTGSILMSLVSLLTLWLLFRSQSTALKRADELVRANNELLRFAKSSAIGSISSHLIHGLKGPISSLKDFIAFGRSNNHELSPQDWDDAQLSSTKAKKLIDEVMIMLRDEKAANQSSLFVSDLKNALLDKFQNDPTLPMDAFSCEELGQKLADLELPMRHWNLLFLVLTNLIENALEAAIHNPEVILKISDEDRFISFRVIDNAGGIPQNLISGLFEPKVSQKPLGSGIGLAISHQLMKQAGGQLSLEKSDESGSVFYVSLPLEEEKH